MMRKKYIWTICALLLGLFVLSEIIPAGISVFAAGEAATIENNGSRLVAKTENIASPTYQWMICDTKDGTYTSISEATEKYYDITAADEGKYIKVSVNGTISEPAEAIGKLIVFDVAKGSVTLGDTYSGKDSEGNDVNGSHAATNIYVIQQSTPGTMTTNKISFTGNHVDAPFDVTLDNVNMGAIPTNNNQAPGVGGSGTPSTGHISIPATNSEVKKVTLRLKGENALRNITYYIGGDTSNPQQNVKSSLKITNINGDGEVEGGSLYIPKKLETDEIEEFVKTNTNYNHWNAGIGGTDSSSLMQNFEIAGGKIQVVTTLGDNCTAIGAGGNGYCQMEISGGEVIAHCNGTGAAIGGGIGWNAAGGRANVLISGGNVYAKNHGNITEKIDGQTEMVGGVAIGSGSSFKAGGTEGAVTITGGTVEAYGTFGNGIGGGNSSTSAGGKATINISGGTVIASSIGGGNSRKGTGGEATVTIDGSADVTLTGGIGGGDSYSGDGGAATITVNAGTMLCGGVIGGGNGGVVNTIEDTGDGGTAKVIVNGGTLTAASIGGGKGSTDGNGGAADIKITGGTIETGSIGGGSTENTTDGKLGYAKANISGGDISGQFLMAAGGTEPCSFKMTGGLLHNVNTADTSKYQYTEQNGAAVYMDDPNGIVNISGGTIENCQAENGGAVYMTAGTFTMSGTGMIQNCTATVNGGAVYLGGGTMNVNGGTIKNNSAAENGGAIYLSGGEMFVTAGEISYNTAQNDGGAAYINGGNFELTGGNIVYNTAVEGNGGGVTVNNGNYMMVGGSVDYNTTQKGNGGGIYVSSEGTNEVNVDILSGSVSNNSAQVSGGALAVVGKEDGTIDITVNIGVNKQHYETVTEDGVESTKKIDCDHDIKNKVSSVVKDCPKISGNKAQISGGAILVTGNDRAKLNVYCLQRANNIAVQETKLSDFMKVEGGTVVISSSSNTTDEQLQDSTHGDITIPDTIYVTGGKMDIWGKMTNPFIEDIITVDIEKTGDHFIDHRELEGYYWLRYFENFEDPVTHIVTGQYKQKSIKIGTEEEISGNIYSHPGYTLQGWNTDNKAAHYWEQGDDVNRPQDQDKDTGWYRISKFYMFDGNPIGNLEIYAIWEPNGYSVVFNPNVPLNETYSGEMERMDIAYEETKDLPKNQYKRDGYIFTGWCKDVVYNPEEGDILYLDQQPVKNLTTDKGELVTLYAQWEKCEHNPESGKCYFIYSVVDEGKTLKRTCSCEGLIETATLYAEDTVYDQEQHEAEVTYSSATWKPIATYQKKEGENFVSHNEIPKNAGTYMASVTDGGETASITYIIEKADQPAPNIPEYVPVIDKENGKSTLKIKPVQDSPISETDNPLYDASYDSKKEYLIVYYDGDTKHEMGWEVGEYDGEFDVSFDLTVALTNYSVYARYGEGTNYKASPETAADSVYFFTGNVKLIIEKGEGVEGLAKEATGGDDVVTNGILLNVITKEGYYLPDHYDIEIQTKKFEQPDVMHDQQAKRTLNDGATPYLHDYKITNIPSDCELHVKLPNAKKIPTISAKVTEKQVFGTVNTGTATISRDSAYTAYFEITNYDKDVYSNLVFDFNYALPKKTNVILVDKVTGKYYWKEIDNAVSSIRLTSFDQMGSGEVDFSLPNTTVIDQMKLQLVIDFSEVDEKNRLVSETDLTTTLSASKNANNAPELSAMVTTKLKNEHRFDLELIASEEATIVSSSTGLTLTMTLSDGVASKWDNRQMALVLTPDGQTDLPPDAYIRYKRGNDIVNVYLNNAGLFILPLENMEATNVDVTLMSSLFTEQEVSYGFKADWISAQSIAEQSPVNGQIVDTISEVNINRSKESVPSIKIKTGKPYYTNQEKEEVKATITWDNILSAHDIEVALQVKNEKEEYTNTGMSWDLELTDSGSKELEVVIPDIMIARDYDSFCLNITVDSGLVTVAEANCYFIIEK